MIVQQHLEQFYLENGIPEDGGASDKTFQFKIIGLNLTLPNPEFRRKVTHIHDIQHVLFDCDVSWEGEAFIAGWEISTGMWKHFPVGFLSLWAMGYSFWVHPKSVYQGFRKGTVCKGIIELGLSKKDLLESNLELLRMKVEISNKQANKVTTNLLFFFSLFLSQLFLIFPLILLILLIGAVI